MELYYIYRHIRLDKNEPFYIGLGKVYSKNPKTHEKKYERAYQTIKRNRYWDYIVGVTDYEVEILFESENKDFIKEKEIEFISLHGRKDLNKGTL